MESKTQSPSPDNADAKAAFRKPSNDTANRKYRRRSPVSGSSSSDGSPKRTRGSSPIHQREDPARDSDPRRRKDDGRDFDKYSDRYYNGRSDDSYRHSDRQSSRSYHNHHRRDDCVRHEKHTDEEERNYSKSSSRSGRGLGVGTQSGHTRRESEHYRSRDHLHGDDKYSRDRYDDTGNKSRDKQRDTSSLEYQKHKDKDSLSDRAVSGRRHANLIVEDIKSGGRDRNKGDGDSRDGKRDYQRSLGNYRNDRSPVCEEHMGPQKDSVSQRDNAGHRMKEASKSDPRELDCQKYTKEEKKKYDDRETSRYKDRYDRDPGEQLEKRIVFTSENQESAAKKPKLFTSSSNLGKDVSKLTTIADENKSSSSKQAHDLVGKVTSEQAPAKGYEAANDLDAAMKAAELVNKNLIGMSYMSTDQKKKLLWGNKKSTNAEESGHRWDTALFSDRERQEKFNKLMGVKGDVKVEHKPNDNQESNGLLQPEKQRELQLDLEKQYTAGLRRRDGRTVGLGL